MKKTLKTVFGILLSIGILIGIYLLAFVMTYDEYKKESFQREIVESLGVTNEKRNFIMSSVKVENQPIFNITILSWSNGTRSTIYDEVNEITNFFHFEDGVISTLKTGEKENKKNGSREEFLDELFLVDIDWSKSSCNAKVDGLSLEKKKNSLTVNFTFEKDYKLTLQIPSLEKTFVIEDVNVSYRMRLEAYEDKNYTWPAFFLLEGKVNGKKIVLDYMQ